MTNKMVYVAHPYNGKEKNKKVVDQIMKELIMKDRNKVYFSPIHNFGMIYFEKRYEEGLGICLEALGKCDALVLCGDWRQSKGCIGEWAYAKARGIGIYTLHEWNEALKNAL